MKFKRLLAAVLAALMLLSLVACGAEQETASKQELPEVQLQNTPSHSNGKENKPGQSVSLSGGNGSQGAENLSRPDKELIADLVTDQNPADLSDKELDQLVDQVIREEGMTTLPQENIHRPVEKEPAPALPDVYDENGAMEKPFDQVYPELMEKEEITFSGESILVKLKGDTLTDGLKKAGIGSLDLVVPMEDCGWYEAMLTEGTEAEAALASVRALKEVLLAEYNYEIRVAVLDDYKHFDKEQGEDFEKNGHNKDQWHFHHCGIPDAYGKMKTEGGDPSVIVAVIDSGVDYDHEDLKDNIWINADEVPGNGQDDDNNGYVDDYYGVDIVAGKGNGDDTNGHGTHVAGIIAARNNKVGVVGIAYNVKIMSVKAAMHNGTLNQADIAKAVLYAYENGAEVINMSFGGTACSIAVQDALATAYTRCVLVASAGNNGKPNEDINNTKALPNYPAALTYVLGVMSVDEEGRESAFSNWDAEAYNGIEYELYAPGENIMSTLPDNQYGYLSGTSMAAPMVAAFAAILRSEYADREAYPTKFIYGQLASTSGYYADCLNPELHGEHHLPQIVNLNDALTKLPKPEVSVQEYHIFDDPKYSNQNNGDGVIDAGETIALGLILRNRWGMSENTMVTIDTISSNSGLSDPYFTIRKATVDYGSVGTYSTKDCGKIYTDGLFTGWENPFLITVSEDCPNDYRFTLNVTITCENALDKKDKEVYTTHGAVNEKARSGCILPSIIEEDMVLTSDKLYIIPNATVIQEGVTVRAEAGTHIQFWSDDGDDPYGDSYIAYLLVNGSFLAEGTRENPVYIYPSQLMDQYNVELGASGSGYVSLKYADVTNLYVCSDNTRTGNRIDLADHCTFRSNYSDKVLYRYLSGGKVTNSQYTYTKIGTINAKDCVFYKLALSYYLELYGHADRCIFTQCGITYKGTYQNSVFLGNALVDAAKPDRVYSSSMQVSSSSGPMVSIVYYNTETATTYILANRNNGITHGQLKEALGVKELPYAVIETEEERQQLSVKLNGSVTKFRAGIVYDEAEKSFVWSDGSVIGEYMDPDGYRKTANSHKEMLLYMKDASLGNKLLQMLPDTSTSTEEQYALYELPGQVLPTEITFKEYVLSTDLESSIQLAPMNAPVQLPVDSFLYESSNERIVTVSDTGLITPVGIGTAEVWVYSRDKAVKNHVTVQVKDYVPLERLTFAEESKLLYAGEIYNVGCSFTPADTTRRNVVYTSSNEAVATVDQSGNITGIATGTAIITATCEGFTATMDITVYQKAKSLTLSKAAMAVSLSEGAVALPDVITEEGAEMVLVWGSTDREVADIENGVLVLKKLGTTTIYVRDTHSGLMVSCPVIVQEQAQPRVKDLYASGQYHFALLDNGDLYYWDYNRHNTPVLVTTDVAITSASMNKVLLQKADGAVELWEILSTATCTKRWEDFKGREILGMEYLYGTSIGSSYFIYTADGCTYAMGNPSSGHLGLGTIEAVNSWELVMLEDVVDVLTYNNMVTYFLTKTGNLYYAGGHNDSLTPVLMAQGVSQICCNSTDSIIVKMDSGEFYWRTTSGSTSSYGSEWNEMESFRCIAAHSTYGAGIRNGQVYFGKLEEKPGSPIPGITNAVKVWVSPTLDNGNYTLYILTEDDLLYGVGGNSLSNNHFAGVTAQNPVTTPVMVPILPLEKETVSLESTNLSDGLLTEDRLLVQFNKELTGAAGKLYAGDIQIVAHVNPVELGLLEVTRSVFAPDTAYRLVFPAGSLTGICGVTNEEEIVISFQYTGGDESENIPENTPEDTPVIYESQLDKTVERIWTKELIQKKLDALQAAQKLNGSFHHNAILNPVSTDTEVSHWLRFQAPTVSAGSYSEIPMAGNWWGTTNETAIGLQMIDYTDFPNYARLMYAPFLQEAPENTFPFVTAVELVNKYGELVTTVGNEKITFRVRFNRDMDTTVPLLVRFGSAYPYGDYEISGTYVNARTWEGTYTLNTLIENGNQFFTISNGWSATEDLALQPDQARFDFVIDTTAAQALVMQGTALDTGIALNWTQDDFDTLMGYNVYRSTKEDGLYTKLNTTVIPWDTMTFFDDTVEPGTMYYYNFTVVQSDMTESEPSGKIVIVSKDTMAPDIYHTPVATAFTGSNLVLTATVTDNLSIAYANLYYRVAGTEGWSIIRMNSLNDKYSAIIPAAFVTVAGIEYYIEAYDGVSYTYKGSAEAPYIISVQEAVDSNALGDVDGDGAITNLDALLLLYAINDNYNMTAEEFARADLNGDGELWAAEALRILQYVSGVVGSVKL